MKPQVSSRAGRSMFTSHTFSAYSRTARSDENHPMRAVLRMAARHQPRLAIERVDRPLRRPVGVEIGRDHEVIVVEQRFDERAEPVRLVGRERAAPDAGDRLGQARRLALPPRGPSKRACRRCSISSAVRPKMKMLSAPTRSRISMLAPSSVPMVSAPFSASFMLPVPDASMPAVEICSDRSAAGMMSCGEADIVVRQEHDLQPAAAPWDRR